MTKLIFLLLSFSVSLSLWANPQVFTTGRYYYNIYPYHELSTKMKRESMKHAREYIVNNIKELIGEADVLEKPIEFVTKNKKALENIGLNASYYLQDSPPFASWHNLIPSAFVFTFGSTVTPVSKLQTRFGLSIGGSFTIGLVIQPVWVERIDVTDLDKIESFLRFQGSVVLIGVGNVGVKTALNPEEGSILKSKMRLGAGFIFGEMNHPSEFNGVTAGVSVTIPKSVYGIQYKGSFVQSTTGPKFGYLSIGFVPGAVGIAPHANIGWVQPLSHFLGAVNKITGKFLTRKELNALEKEIAQ